MTVMLIPKNFKLKQLDTDKWVQDLMSTGSKGVIITAKHHDGFCLFNSKYTDYCIRNTPYKSGQGDIVKELSESCKKFGFKLGIYLSPWDRHEPTYGTEAYNDYFCNQLEELCTNYGDYFFAFGLTVPAARAAMAKNSAMIGSVIMQPFINISRMPLSQTAVPTFGG